VIKIKKPSEEIGVNKDQRRIGPDVQEVLGKMVDVTTRSER